MSPKERTLAVAVASLVLCLGGYFTFAWVQGQFARRETEKTKLESDIRNFKRQVLVGQLAAKKIAEYETRSLPPNVEIARTEYQSWLLHQVEKAGLDMPDVGFKSAMPEGDLFVRQTFTVSAEGTLPQAIDLLHAFYSVDWLHRIVQLRLKPIKDSKKLDVILTVEALSLKKAKDTAQLEPRPGKRLLLADRQAYHDAIAGRNVFGPPNNAPRIALSGSKDVYLGRAAELTVKGTDPDQLDKLRYRLVQAPDDSARFDEEKGRLVWSPKALGKYEFVFEAVDDGLPSKSSNREKIVVNVTEQPPPTKPALAFDHARLTMLTAVLDLDGKGEIWLHVRPTGQTLKLHEGEEFEIGSIKGKVSEINQHDFVFVSDGKLRKLIKGNFLEKAEVVPEGPSASTSTSAAVTSPEEKREF